MTLVKRLVYSNCTFRARFRLLEVKKYRDTEGLAVCSEFGILSGMEAVCSRGGSDDDTKSLCFLIVPFIIACSWVLIFP